ncbi:MAG: dTMP kinase [Candidatus Aenigmarchaeota archaeon ex4484_56]|nr:MAG: dTMP kinase [Candidatus Aenigmarchaeota archaeon ex4484_56]
MGFFVVFEGLDGSGTSTQAHLLTKYLRKTKKAYFLTKEPTNNLIGGLIRGQLTNEWKSSMECLQLLFAADRAHHLEKEIDPALKKGFIVVCDRYKLSSIAYGSTEADTNWLIRINEKFREPDLTILLKVSPKKCIERIKGRFSFELFERENILSKVWSVYEVFVGGNIVMVDGERSIEDIHKDIVSLIEKKLMNREIATTLL